MSITDLNKEEYFSHRGEKCFFCWKVITDKRALYWGGVNAMYLHPKCFIKLTTRLFRDYHEMQITEE
jgi:hypothetical protein